MHKTTLDIQGRQIPVTCANTIIVGAGAAGMNCAAQLVRFYRQRGVADPQDKVLVVTGGLRLGASRMSGSDKQTYYKMGTSPRVPDTAEDFAKTLTAFGCCHGDNALVEGICSLRGFYNLVEQGVPFPHEPFGAFIGYKTDHDPYERATSAGPKTSKFMSESLQAQIQRMGVQIVDAQLVGRFVTADNGDEKRIVALVCFDLSRANDQAVALSVFVAQNWVLAGGGPGELYETTVYPRGQFGLHAPALQAGLEACNLTESQFGLASISRESGATGAGKSRGKPYKGFRWNVSGTYMQVIPRIYSTDPEGTDEREFLVDYFDNMSEMASNIFLKGYQWPFDAQRITDHRSSLIDMAVHQETVVRGRRVWMDFLANPVGANGWDAFDIDALSPEALEYLKNTGAMQATPIERLRHMNPPAIEIYAENGIDLASEPLEIAVCAQHMNGGFAVDKWWQSNVAHTFVIGEMAGTHGVKRPGGSALNAGQVGAARAAEYIANVYGADEPDASALTPKLTDEINATLGCVGRIMEKACSATVTPAQAMDQIRRRMTRFGAHLRSKDGAAKALEEAKTQLEGLMTDGLKIDSPRELTAVARARQQCLTHVAMLKAICAMFERSAGSRGSHCILDADGVEMHPKLLDDATGAPYRFRPENESLRDEILYVKYNGNSPDLFDVRVAPPRPIPDRQIAFEPAWTEFREGAIYEI